MSSFSHRHPFLTSLIKRVITIGVSWTAVLVCIVVTISGLGVIGILMALGSSVPDSSYSYVYGSGNQELLSIRVTGPITGSEGGGGLFSERYTSGYDVKDKLHTAASDDLIKGVILEINSPGGTIYGARAIADGITYYRQQTHRPVFVYVEGLAASGAYWGATAANKIIADYGSDVGSIGVIMGPFQYYDGVIAEDGGLLSGGVVTQRGIEHVMITAGKSKDVGSPYRRLTTDEMASLQKSVNNEYDNFVSYVSEHRNIPADKIRNTLGAMVYDNRTAEEYGLIDATGSRDAAYADLARSAGVGEDYTIIRQEATTGFWEAVLSSISRKPAKTADASIDLCSLTRTSLAYHGDVTELCNK